MKHIMFDLETLGTNSHAPVVQVAACLFNIDGEVLSEYNAKIDLADSFPAFQAHYVSAMMRKLKGIK